MIITRPLKGLGFLAVILVVLTGCGAKADRPRIDWEREVNASEVTQVIKTEWKAEKVEIISTAFPVVVSSTDPPFFYEAMLVSIDGQTALALCNKYASQSLSCSTVIQ